MKQSTIAQAIECSGIGLHSGMPSKIIINPSRPDTGIVFRKRCNASEPVILKACYNNVIATELGTTIGNKADMTVLTIEHLMSALWACDVDNAVIDVFENRQEIPICDGSAIEFIKKIKSVGTSYLDSARKFLKIQKKIRYTEQDKFIEILPYNGFCVDIDVEFSYGQIGHQSYSFNGDKLTFIENIARARTFCNQDEVDRMHSLGLAKGGSLDNSLVFNSEGVVNPSGLRYQNEVVRHKLLDCIGDLFTCGYNIHGKIIAHKAGHRLHNMLLKSIFSEKENYIIE